MKITTREMTKAAIFPALMIATAGISIPLTGAPITLQTLFVMLAGMINGPKLGFGSMVIYILLGIIGLPVFANYQSGLGVILGPTGGFILSFPIAALIVGLIVKRNSKLTYIVAGIIATLIIYIIGIPWMSFILGWKFPETLLYMTIYFPGDIIKILVASLITNRLILYQKYS